MSRTAALGVDDLRSENDAGKVHGLGAPGADEESRELPKGLARCKRPRWEDVLAHQRSIRAKLFW